MARAVAILNPKAAGGRTARVWPRYEQPLRGALGELETLFTEGPNHATELARRALESGAELVAAGGGDGTANEVVNGFFDGREPINPRSRFGLVPIGTGGDLQRTLALPTDPQELARTLASGRTRELDVVFVRLTGSDGAPVTRLFVNLASFGMGGDVSVLAKNCFLTPVHGKAAFLWATLLTALRFRGKSVRVRFDGETEARDVRVMNVAIGNGRYHGGGMLPCPEAKMDDGLLDVTTIEYLPLWKLVRDLRMLYSGKVYEHPQVSLRRATRLRAEADEEVRAEVDGEALGRLPLEAEVLPGKLRAAAGPD